MFGLEFVHSNTVRKDALREDIIAAMAATAGCGCSGESQPCHPEKHYFPPDNFLPASAGVGGSVDSLLTTGQHDVPVTSLATQFVNPSLPVPQFTLPPDVEDQRRNMLTAASDRQAQHDAEVTAHHLQVQRDRLRQEHGITVSDLGMTLGCWSRRPLQRLLLIDLTFLSISSVLVEVSSRGSLVWHITTYLHHLSPGLSTGSGTRFRPGQFPTRSSLVTPVRQWPVTYISRNQAAA